MPRIPRCGWSSGAVALVLSLVLAGCASTVRAAGPTVTLRLSAPADASRVSADTTTVRGTVRPARARVEVLGQPVRVARDGSFSAQIRLAVGTNLIDVIASLPRSAGAVSAVAVSRFLLISVPQVDGEDPQQAAAALRALGLAVRINGSSDPFGFLIPASTSVCSTSPVAGARVDPGATVTLNTGKLCSL